MSACFYTGSNYKGDKECLNRGQYNNVKYDDRYSSAQPSNLVAFLYEHANFDGDFLRVDKNTPSFPRLDNKTSSIKVLPNCDMTENIWEPECDYNKNLFNQLDTKRSDFCNSTRTNALSQKCISWCQENRGKCAMLNKEVACKKYDIPSDICTDEEVMNIEGQCVQYGLIDPDSKTTTAASIYQCNKKGLDTLFEQCKKFELLGSDCTAPNVSYELTAELFNKTSNKLLNTLEEQYVLNSESRDNANNKLLEFLETSQQKSDSLFSKISDANKSESNKQIEKAYSLLENISNSTPPPPKKNYTQTYIIIVLVSCIFMIFLSGIIFLIKKN